MLSANSGKPSFLTKGKIAALYGASAGGKLKTERVSPFSKASSFKAEDKTAKNKRSKPTDVSTT